MQIDVEQLDQTIRQLGNLIVRVTWDVNLSQLMAKANRLREERGQFSHEDSRCPLCGGLAKHERYCMNRGTRL